MTIEDLIIALQDLAHRWDTSECFTGDSHYDLGHDVGKQQCSEELTEILDEYEKVEEPEMNDGMVPGADDPHIYGEGS